MSRQMSESERLERNLANSPYRKLEEAQKTIRILKEAINDALAAWDPLPPGEYYSKEEHEARNNLEKVYENS